MEAKKENKKGIIAVPELFVAVVAALAALNIEVVFIALATSIQKDLQVPYNSKLFIFIADDGSWFKTIKLPIATLKDLLPFFPKGSYINYKEAEIRGNIGGNKKATPPAWAAFLKK